jgi:hypothetical protein
MKSLLVLLGAVAVITASCATVQQNVDARKLLAECRWEWAGVKVTGVQFSQGIVIDAVNLEASVKLTNTTSRDVALDHATLSFLLDKNPVLDTAHQKFVRVAPTVSVVEPVSVVLPFSGIVKALGHRPEVLGVRAKLWVTLLIGKDTWETPLVIPVDVDVPVPYDQIDAFVAQKKKELEAEAARSAAAAAKAALPSLPSAPHF